ncbi:MAG: MAPEG family protein [Kangiellaceae bacterium]|jgi:uncharacterized MAPEG superfamily protein|nr:MAPEG family protein [Kangiellaceae bacterium]
MQLQALLGDYSLTFWGLWTILFLILVQAIVASVSHRKQKKYIPGIVDANLSHESMVFRSHRTHQNSLENIMIFFGPVVIALLTGFDAQNLAIIVWVYAIARIIHTVLYYTIATEKNPSPRSYFYIIALLANIVLFVMLAMHLAR